MDKIVSTFGLDWRLLLIQGFNFALLLFLLWYFLYRPILRIIDERRAKVAEGVRLAEAAGQQVEDAKREGQRVVGEAGREAEQLVAAAKQRADEKGSEILRLAEERAQGVLAEAKAKAEEEHRQTMRQSEREIARAAMLAAEKILREQQ